MSEQASLAEALEQRLNELLQRLEQILERVEQRLSGLESLPESTVLRNERTVAEQVGELGGQALVSSQGTIERITRVPVCDVCGVQLQRDFFICSCGRKVCPQNTVQFESRRICTNCLQAAFPLPKQAFKVVVAIANQITGIKDISSVTLMTIESVRYCLAMLVAMQLVGKAGFWIFSKPQVTDRGMIAIGLYRQVFGSDADVLQFDVDLRRFLFNGQRSVLASFRL